MSKCSWNYKDIVCRDCGIKCPKYYEWVYDEYNKMIMELRTLTVCMDGAGQLGPRNAIMAIVRKYNIKFDLKE